MPQYTYLCLKDGNFEVTRHMRDVKATEACPICQTQASRNFQVDLTGVPAIWYTDGSHKGDYSKTGHKQDQAARQYEKTTGEKAPPPATDVPKNYKVEHDPSRHEKRKEKNV